MSAVLNLSKIRSNKQSRKTQYETEFDPEYGVLWAYINADDNQCFTTSLLDDIRSVDSQVIANKGHFYYEGERTPINYYVVGSKKPSVFSFGGDLALFSTLIKLRDRDALFAYAELCIDNLFPKIQNFFCDSMTTISLVQGDALGGGFETVLSSDIIIAEEHTKMGLPEILFNLFPGMGAYSLLSRKIGMSATEKLITSGDILSAEQLYKLGIVDILAPTGMGEAYVYDYIKTNHRKRNGLQAIHKTRNLVNPITREELMQITELWVDAALRLDEKDLKMMHRLVRAQSKRIESNVLLSNTVEQHQTI